MKKIFVFICMFFCISIVNASVNYEFVWKTESIRNVEFDQDIDVNKMDDGYLIYTHAMSGSSDLTKVSLDGKIINAVDIGRNYVISNNYVFNFDTTFDVIEKYDKDLNLVDSVIIEGEAYHSYSYFLKDDKYFYFYDMDPTITRFVRVDHDLNIEYFQVDMGDYYFYDSDDEYMYFLKVEYVETDNYNLIYKKVNYNFELEDTFIFNNYSELEHYYLGTNKKYFLNPDGDVVTFNINDDDIVSVAEDSEIMIAIDLYDTCERSQCSVDTINGYYYVHDYSVTDDEWLDYIEGVVSIYDNEKNLIYSFNNYYIHNITSTFDVDNGYIASFVNEWDVENGNKSFIYSINSRFLNEIDTPDAYAVDILDGELFVVCRDDEGTYFEKYLLNYFISKSETKGGSVTFDAANAVPGEVVKLNIKVEEGYVLGAIEIIDEAGNIIEVNNGEFIMPASNVSIKVIFVVKNSETSDIILLVIFSLLLAISILFGYYKYNKVRKYV